MRKNISYCHPSFSQENVKGSSDYKIIKSGGSLDLAYQLGAMTRRGYSLDCHVASLLTMTAILFSFNAQATCTPTPDCADMGYTETSCDGKFVRCPFDTSKLFCAPCDSKFLYDCVGDNMIGGTGHACNNKYVSCECEDGYYFKNGVCPQNCPVGYIYYSDKSCSADYDNSKTAIGIVVKDNELVMSNKLTTLSWGGDGININGITDIGDTEIAKADFEGKANTLAIVSQLINGTASDTAAIYCNEYAPTDMTNSKGQWYLPAGGELYNYVYGNLGKVQTTAEKIGWYLYWSFWSSSEANSGVAWGVSSGIDLIGTDVKTNTLSITCFLEINSQ